MAEGAAREVVYRLRPRAGASPSQLPLLLSQAGGHITIETTAAHLDDSGHVWRILAAHGTRDEVRQARAAFEAYSPVHVVEKQVLGASPQRLILWYKYRPDVGGRPSHTALAFRILGRDTVITDRTRDGLLSIRVLARSGQALQEFLRAVRRETAAAGMAFELLYSGPPRDPAAAGLTATEEQTLRQAATLGYYDVPRAVGVRDVAKAMGLSASAAGYRLRRAEQKLVQAYLESE